MSLKIPVLQSLRIKSEIGIAAPQYTYLCNRWLYSYRKLNEFVMEIERQREREREREI